MKSALPQSENVQQHQTEDCVFTMDHSPCGPDKLLPQYPEESEAVTPVVQPVPDDVITAFRNFQEALDPGDTPFVNSFQSMRNPWAEPDYCLTHIREPVEPEYGVFK